MGVSDGAGDFHVERWVDVLGGFVERRKRLWRRLGDLETRLLADEIEDRVIDRPVYVSGLARSGSTLLLETLAQHPAVVTHRYRDYPPVYTPLLWNRLLDRMPRRHAEPTERAHRDGILVTADSPEALEEVLWMAFFPHCHDPARSNVLDGDSRNPEFEAFYRAHLRKLMRLRGGDRYVAKGNYNVTRLEYLLRLFPDARFVIPVREPAAHIASLMKQHWLFCDAQQGNRAALDFLRRVGHYEFGLDRRPINAGDERVVAAVAAAWAEGEEVLGWARYWAHVYGYLAERLAAKPALEAAACVVRFEDLCAAPRQTLATVFGHCGLADAATLIDDTAATVHLPTYYRAEFSDEERAVIARETAAVAAHFGYRDY